MPVYHLTQNLIFPPPEGASREGVVAIGGDTSPERLILAYSQGIFPWPHEGMPLLWFSPDPRFILELGRVRVSRSLRKSVRKNPYEIRSDSAFRQVMESCARMPRPNQDGTWITEDLVKGFCSLHRSGLAHSIEAWRDGRLVGGLYGISLGGAFFGESMFAREPDASKIATVTLLGNLYAWEFSFVDCQIYTDHLARFGAIEWPRRRYLDLLRNTLSRPTRQGRWRLELGPIEALDRILGSTLTLQKTSSGNAKKRMK
ncbi:MAG: leucyl/phenylalanyl-tRNA--protein transferase [Deltaproteobacteria bacterium]|nr:leucyl/phenylalanyl-tRNA--protein transferase [Deltaproteobacteria bacterium]